MAVSAYEVISTQTLSTTAATVTLSSIPQTYTDLVLVLRGTSTVDDTIMMQFNSDTGSNYSWTQFGADGGSGVFSSRGSGLTSFRIGYGNTGQGSHITQVINYSNATTFKTSLSRSNKGADDVRAIVGLWRNTNAITSLTIIQTSGSFATGTTISLYGIKASV
jgi:hypothetical protein